MTTLRPFVVAIPLCFLLACRLLVAADSKSVDKTLPLPLTGSVTFDGHNGSLTVETWDRPQIEIHARIKLNSSSGVSDADRRRFDETRVEIESAGDSVRINSKYPEWSWSASDPEIHYTIRAPRTARWTVRDHNSRIEVSDLQASLSISTHNSRVFVSGQAGPLTLDTHNADAKVRFASFTGSSSIDTHNGDVEVSLPATSKFNLDASSHNGRFESDFVILNRSNTHRRPETQGTVNGGGPALRLSSHNGNFRLRAL